MFATVAEILVNIFARKIDATPERFPLSIVRDGQTIIVGRIGPNGYETV